MPRVKKQHDPHKGKTFYVGTYPNTVKVHQNYSGTFYFVSEKGQYTKITKELLDKMHADLVEKAKNASKQD